MKCSLPIYKKEGTKEKMSKQQESTDLSKGSPARLLFKLALPAIVAQIINVLYNMVDRMYIGHIPNIGPQALTGVGVTMPIIMSISAFAALVSMGGAPRAAIMMGKKEEESAQKILGNCFSALIIVAVLLTVFFQLFGRQILLMFGASNATIDYAWQYMSIYTLGTIFVQIALGMNAFITTQGFAKISMVTVMIGAICNIILDPIFIFVLGFGVKGAAFATIISQGISSIWVIRFLMSSKSNLKIQRKYLKIEPKILLPCLALGISPFIMQFTESALTISFNTSLQKYGGDLAVGAMTILYNVMQFSMLPLQGLAQGAQPIISFNYGANRLDRVKQTFICLLTSSLIYSTTIWAISMFAPIVFIKIFTDNASLIEMAIHSMRIYMAASLILGAQIACQQTFISLGNAIYSLFLALLRKVILLIPLIFILPIFLTNKVDAVLLAEPIADIIAVSTTCSLFYYSFKKLSKRNTNSPK